MNRYPIPVLLCVLFLLAGCASHPATSTPSQELSVYPVDASDYFIFDETPEGGLPTKDSISTPDERAALDAYRKVLLGGVEFFSTDHSENMDLESLVTNLSSDEDHVRMMKLTIADLDQDGTQEVILWESMSETNDFGFEILHLQNDRVYGYALTDRALRDLKADGTFYVSGSAYDYGFGTIYFTEDTWMIKRAATCETSIEADGSEHNSYVIGGEDVSEEEFQLAMDRQNEKTDAIWYDFTDKTIEALLSADDAPPAA